MEQPAGDDHLLVVADDLERISVHPRQRRPLRPLEAVALVAADDEVVEAHLDAVLGPEDDEILALRCIERVDDCGLIAEQPVGVLGPQIEEAGETALIGRQPERLAVGGPIVLALLDHRVPDAHRCLEQAVLYKVKKLPASKLEPSLDLVKTVICPFVPGTSVCLCTGLGRLIFPTRVSGAAAGRRRGEIAGCQPLPDGPKGRADVSGFMFVSNKSTVIKLTVVMLAVNAEIYLE